MKWPVQLDHRCQKLQSSRAVIQHVFLDLPAATRLFEMIRIFIKLLQRLQIYLNRVGCNREMEKM